jgi:hypothetical protein
MDRYELEIREMRAAFRKHSTSMLREIRASKKDTTREAAVLDQMLHERAFWQKFWTSGIVAWVSLAVSVAAFIVSLMRHAQ